MNIFSLIKNPLFRIVGILLIIYFGIIKNYRDQGIISKDKLKNDLTNAKNQISYISSNIEMAKQINNNPNDQNIFSSIEAKDLNIGNNNKKAFCGDEVNLSYKIFLPNSKNLIKSDTKKIIVGSGQNLLLEKLILGANEEAIRVVTIPKNILILDPEINELINIYNSSLVYEIKIEFIKSNNTNSLNC